MKYLAVIGDVVDSKRVKGRKEFQSQLADVLKRASQRNAALVSPYTITLGDEFQAVYRQADRLFVDLFAILREVHPVEVRFAVGLGELSTAINPKQALGMDGPAFHRAREGIIGLKKTEFRLRIQGDDSGIESVFDPWRLINHLLNLVSHKTGSWGRNRWHILSGLLTGRTVAELEEELKISRVAVYKNINAAALDEIKESCDEITRFLNQELKKQ